MLSPESHAVYVKKLVELKTACKDPKEFKRQAAMRGLEEYNFAVNLLASIQYSRREAFLDEFCQFLVDDQKTPEDFAYALAMRDHMREVLEKIQALGRELSKLPVPAMPSKTIQTMRDAG